MRHGNTQQIDRPEEVRGAGLWKHLVAYVVVSFGIALSGWFYYAQHERQHIDQVRAEVSTVADLKVEQISVWRSERLSDGAVIGENFFVAQAAAAVVSGASSTGDIAGLEKCLSDLLVAKGYTHVMLLTTNCLVALPRGASRIIDCEWAHRTVALACTDFRPQLSDIHVSADNARPHMDLVAPVLRREGGATDCVAAVLAVIDPDRHLYPLIQRWPTASSSAETLLARRDGEAIVYLNELRHRSGTALKLRIPADETNVIAARAFSEGDGLYDGIDYRGLPVLGCARRIGGTPWVLVAKIDRSEYLAPLQRRGILVAIVGVGLIVLSWHFVALAFSRQRTLEKRRLLDAELRRIALVRHYEYLTKYANDIILLADADARTIVEVNDAALKAYGYSREEMIGMNVALLRRPDDVEDQNKRLALLESEKSANYETIHKRKDGTVFPVDVSLRLFELEGRRYHQVIMRDITERKRIQEALEREQERLHQILENMNSAVAVYEPVNDGADFVLRGFNAAAERIEHISREAVLGRSVCEMFPGVKALGLFEVFQRVYKTGRPEHHPAGLYSDGRVSGWRENHVHKLSSGEVVAIYDDVTERKLADDRIAGLNRLYSVLSEVSQSAIHAKNRDELFANMCAIAVEYGKFKMAWIGIVDPETRNVIPAMAEGDTAGYLSEMAGPASEDPLMSLSPTDAAARTGECRICNDVREEDQLAPWARRASEIGHLSIAAVPFGMGERIVGVLSVYALEPRRFGPEDARLLKEVGVIVSHALRIQAQNKQRKEIDEKLEKSERDYRFLVEHSGQGICIAHNGLFAYVNATLSRMLGYAREELLGRAFVDVIHREDRALVLERHKRRTLGEDVENQYTFRIVRKNGDLRWLEISAEKIEWNGEAATLNFLNDVTEKRETEADRDRLFNMSIDLLCVSGFDGYFKQVNPAWTKTLGWSADELKGKPAVWFVHPDDVDATKGMEASLARGETVVGFENRYKCLDGSYRWISWNAMPMMDTRTIFCVARNITEQKLYHDDLQKSKDELQVAVDELQTAQEKIIQQERLSALGQMVSGISHDFNNTLMPIVGLSDFLLAHPETLNDRAETMSIVKNISMASLESARIVKRLREFYHPDTDLDVEPVDMNSLVQSVIVLTRPAWKGQAEAESRPIEMKAEIGVLPQIMANETQLKEVLTNLIVNAVDAMPKGGTISISAIPAGGDLMELRVRDTGEGMTDDVKKKCIEPFFSTKGAKGTGMGLAMVHGIVTRHGGTIDLESERGKGTTVIIRLPYGSHVDRKYEGPHKTIRRRPGLRVLLIDDDVGIRKLVGKYLEKDRHIAEIVTNGEEGVLKFKSTKFDLVITDRAMPGISGDKVARMIKQIDPDVRIIMLTGFANIMKCKGENPEGVDEMLAKPATIDQLRASIDKVMSRKGGGGNETGKQRDDKSGGA
ncbi:MAG: hypothetical protein C0404_03820 [Verrucomicrobia bacterium]|nr:hypothetical protein [Verrucomicrobiota bacterium]